METSQKTYDFSGWATRNDIKCSDGRTIRKDAFKGNDGMVVPLVWNHGHSSVKDVLGHALLENRDEGVYAYGSFNDTEEGRNAKELVLHGDIGSLSIYANQLKQNGGDVIHGCIKELSLVLAGANPGAYIETVIAHSDDCDEEAFIYNPSEDIEICHGCGSSESKNEEPKKEEKKEKTMEHAKEKTVQEVFDELTEEQKLVVYALIGAAMEDKKEENKENNQEEKPMKHNAFENDEKNEILTHAEFTEIIDDAKKGGSVKDAFLAHSITDVSNLFPEVQAVNKTPEIYARRMEWVEKVMSAVKKSPFSRVKSTYADLTADNARAKGYVKGNQKVEEVIAALKRTTTPTTVYKLQKLNRDDVIDITDFDVIAWIKAEMRVMLDEELARAILIGDGRSSSSDDKINTQNIRPILGDTSTYTVAKTLTRAAGDTDYTFAKSVIKEIIKARKDYKGSGDPTFFTTEDMLTNMLLIEDTNGRVIYDSVAKLATALRVKDIVAVPVFEGQSRTSGGFDYNLIGILVNLMDYNVGADKGGAVNMFDDFDINFNKYEYLIETRCSGALVKPYSAISFEEKVASEAEG